MHTAILLFENCVYFALNSVSLDSYALVLFLVPSCSISLNALKLKKVESHYEEPNVLDAPN